MIAIPWWVPFMPLVGVIVGALLGFGISEYRESRQRGRERIGYLEALAVEINVCGEMAKGYYSANVKAPAYRMPLIAYQRILPELLSRGILTFEETQALFRFYFNAAAFNFSLDQANAVVMKKKEDRPPDRLELEVNRAKIKARKLSKDSDQPNHYNAAIAAIRAHLPRDSNVRLNILDDDLTEEADA